MCGICGWVGVAPPSAAVGVDAMMCALAARGPDAMGCWQAPDCDAVLGHRRLSIIDVEGSPQPMPNEDGSAVVSFNGEIYNFRELRRALEQQGHRFRTQGDTEVLLRLYEEHGIEMLPRLDGIFAFAIWDARRHELLLARDRAGVKPLYYWHDVTSGQLVFASDLAALLASRLVPRRLDARALGQFLHFGYVIHPRTWLRDVRQLAPGSALRWRDGAVRHTTFDRWMYEPDGSLAQEARAERMLEETLERTVQEQLVSDVGIAAFLSGGLDSSLITGLAQRCAGADGQGMRSFTVRSWEPSLDESVRARRIAADLGTQHAEVEAATLLFDHESVSRIVAGLGEPFGDDSALAVYALCQQVRPHTPVALSGDGGDELFLGYAGLRKQHVARRARMLPRPVRRALATLPGAAPGALLRRAGKYARLSLCEDADVIIEWARRWEPDTLAALLGADGLTAAFPDGEGRFPEVRDIIGDGARGGFAEQQIRFHLLVDLPCDCLFKVDRMSMAHGLEVRVPLLGNAMLDFGARLPLAARYRASRTKEPLRSVAERIAPTLREPSAKAGFSFPLDSWLRGSLAGRWREWELTPTLAALGLQPQVVDALLARYDDLT
ncbi:MAG TPA: asparagine synthase (glutamine-hydrolyzing), partial [Gemmatimonadaceae bacterium]|nr:asparagine synthase (glutamine-hydrolyzing) [Gemmatimonadaceae bacterium]